MTLGYRPGRRTTGSDTRAMTENAPAPQNLTATAAPDEDRVLEVEDLRTCFHTDDGEVA